MRSHEPMRESPADARNTGGSIAAFATTLERIHHRRDLYRLAMSRQIINDSVHDRDGWTREYLLSVGEVVVGYGSIAVGGPWANALIVYEVYFVPNHGASRVGCGAPAVRAVVELLLNGE